MFLKAFVRGFFHCSCERNGKSPAGLSIVFHLGSILNPTPTVCIANKTITQHEDYVDTHHQHQHSPVTATDKVRKQKYLGEEF